MAERVRLVGIDLSTDPKKTGIVAIDLDSDMTVAIRTKGQLAEAGDLGDHGEASDRGLCHLLSG